MRQRSAGERRGRIRRQIEHYLSDANLRKDSFFHQKIAESSDGWISIHHLMACPIMQARQATYDEIIASLSSSMLVEVGTPSTGEPSVRRRGFAPLPALVEHAWGYCSSAHLLERTVATDVYTCNLCYRTFVHKLEVIHRCVACDYDECESCHEQKKLKQQIQTLETELQDKRLAKLWEEAAVPGVVDMIPQLYTQYAAVGAILRSVSHKQQWHNGEESRCWAFQKLQIHSVEHVHNPHLWKKYTTAKEDMKKRHRSLDITVAPLDLEMSTSGIYSLLESLTSRGPLDLELNEVVLVHGCQEKAAKAIVKEGFDIRHTSSNGGNMYGEGIYFAKEPCKSCQYSAQYGMRHMFVARVALGDPNFLEGRFTGRLPPFRDQADEAKERFDSNVVNPKKSNRSQMHWESVIFTGEQAYPELLVKYSLPERQNI